MIGAETALLIMPGCLDASGVRVTVIAPEIGVLEHTLMRWSWAFLLCGSRVMVLWVTVVWEGGWARGVVGTWAHHEPLQPPRGPLSRTGVAAGVGASWSCLLLVGYGAFSGRAVPALLVRLAGLTGKGRRSPALCCRFEFLLHEQ